MHQTVDKTGDFKIFYSQDIGNITVVKVIPTATVILIWWLLVFHCLWLKYQQQSYNPYLVFYSGMVIVGILYITNSGIPTTHQIKITVVDGQYSFLLYKMWILGTKLIDSFAKSVRIDDGDTVYTENVYLQMPTM